MVTDGGHFVKPYHGSCIGKASRLCDLAPAILEHTFGQILLSQQLKHMCTSELLPYAKALTYCNAFDLQAHHLTSNSDRHLPNTQRILFISGLLWQQPNSPTVVCSCCIILTASLGQGFQADQSLQVHSLDWVAFTTSTVHLPTFSAMCTLLPACNAPPFAQYSSLPHWQLTKFALSILLSCILSCLLDHPTYPGQNAQHRSSLRRQAMRCQQAHTHCKGLCR